MDWVFRKTFVLAMLLSLVFSQITHAAPCTLSFDDEKKLVLELQALSSRQLREFYNNAIEVDQSSIPTGVTNGVPLVTLPIVRRIFNRMMSLLWKGKIFIPGANHNLSDAWLLNRFPLLKDGKGFKALVRIGESWKTAGTAVILDYSQTSPIPVSWIRDEIREVGPGVYIGYAYIRGLNLQILKFALITPRRTRI